jgi:hypothetical protein
MRNLLRPAKGGRGGDHSFAGREIMSNSKVKIELDIETIETLYRTGHEGVVMAVMLMPGCNNRKLLEKVVSQIEAWKKFFAAAKEAGVDVKVEIDKGVQEN